MILLKVVEVITVEMEAMVLVGKVMAVVGEARVVEDCKIKISELGMCDALVNYTCLIIRL